MWREQLCARKAMSFAAAFIWIVSACSDAHAPGASDITGVFAGEFQDPSFPQCLRVVIHPVSNALGVVGDGLAVQGMFLDCGTGMPQVSQVMGTGRMVGENQVQFVVARSVNPPGGVPPLYRLDLVRQDRELIGTWAVADNATNSTISVRLRVVSLNTTNLTGRYVVASINAPPGYPVVLPSDTLQLSVHGSAYHARCGGATLAEYNRTGNAVALFEYFSPCPNVTHDTLLIRGANLVRRRIYIRITNPALRDTVEEVYVRR